MAKIKNISGDDRIVPSLGDRLVKAGQVVDVPDEEVWGFTCQAPNWAPADEETQAIHDASLAEQNPALVEAILSASAAELVRDSIPTVEDVDLLGALIAAETDGKARTTVLAAAQARLAELVPDDSTDHDTDDDQED